MDDEILDHEPDAMIRWDLEGTGLLVSEFCIWEGCE